MDVCVCMHVFVQICMHTHLSVCINMGLCVYVRMCIYICLNNRMHVYIFVKWMSEIGTICDANQLVSII